MPYKIEDVVPEIIRLLESIGATNIKKIDGDIATSQHTCIAFPPTANTNKNNKLKIKHY